VTRDVQGGPGASQRAKTQWANWGLDDDDDDGDDVVVDDDGGGRL
jgi:hypothetical protein